MKKFWKFLGEVMYRVMVGVVASLIVGLIVKKAKELAKDN